MELRICSSYSLYKFLALCCFLTIVLFLIYSSNTSSNTNHDLYPPTTRFSRVSVKAEPQKFFVKTSKCHIPYVDPFNDEAMELYKPQTLITCSNETDLISTTYNEIIKRHILHIDDEVAQKLLNFTDKDYNCFYREIKYGKIADTYDK